MKLYVSPLPPLKSGESRAANERNATLALLREIFGNEVLYSHKPSGAPLIISAGKEHLVSISHSASTVAIAVADAEEALGVDVETYRVQLERVQSRYLSDAESELFTAPVDKLKAWTAKEAVYKAALTPGLSLTEIDCTRIADGIVTARNLIYSITFPAASLSETIAIVTR
ncbi:MAG: 4'-phosphopantetheinyl transferase superfamily protein [Duncaniella sp.]|nr:4'-phosphopantetheinyl transferase superfamily protein [Duncaniella sp.]